MRNIIIHDIPTWHPSMKYPIFNGKNMVSASGFSNKTSPMKQKLSIIIYQFINLYPSYPCILGNIIGDHPALLVTRKAWVICPPSPAAPAGRSGAHRPGAPGRCPWGTSVETPQVHYASRGNPKNDGKNIFKKTSNILFGWIWNTWIDIEYMDIFF